MKFKIVIFLSLLLGNVAAFSNDLSTEFEAIQEVYYSDDYLRSREMALVFLEKAKDEKDVYYLSKTYYLLGYICSHTDDFGNAIIYYLEGARYAQLSGREDLNTDLISIYKNLSSILDEYKHYDLAHKFINEGLRIASVTVDEKQTISLLNNRIYELLAEERYQEALNQIDSLLDNFSISKERFLMLRNKEAVAYRELGKTDKATEIFESILLEDSSVSPQTYVYALKNLSTINIEKKAYKKALGYLFSAYTFSKQRPNQRMLFDIIQLIGQVYYQLGNYDQAIKYYQEALDLVKKGDQQPYFYEVYKEISMVYTSLKDFPNALKYERIYSEELEKFIAQQRKIEELDKKYNIQLLTDRYFDLLAADSEQKATERTAKISISALVILFLTILFFIYYRQKKTKQSIRNKLLEIDFSSEV